MIRMPGSEAKFWDRAALAALQGRLAAEDSESGYVTDYNELAATPSRWPMPC